MALQIPTQARAPSMSQHRPSIIETSLEIIDNSAINLIESLLWTVIWKAHFMKFRFHLNFWPFAQTSVSCFSIVLMSVRILVISKDTEKL